MLRVRAKFVQRNEPVGSSVEPSTEKECLPWRFGTQSRLSNHEPDTIPEVSDCSLFLRSPRATILSISDKSRAIGFKGSEIEIPGPCSNQALVTNFRPIECKPRLHTVSGS
jgi:hypothetical protein